MTHDQVLTASGNGGTRAGDVPAKLAELVAWETVGPSDTATCSLPPRPESAAQARDFARAALRHWGMSNRSDIAVLVISELVTNALRHAVLSAQWMPGEHPIALILLRRDAHLLCMVSDPASSAPVRETPDAAAEGGRGLQVVESCSAAWGWQPTEGGGKVVWALLR